MVFVGILAFNNQYYTIYMGASSDRLLKLAKRDAVDLREMIRYMESFQESTFKKAIISYFKRQLESINTMGPVISWNMHKDEFKLFQKFVSLTLSERDELKAAEVE